MLEQEFDQSNSYTKICCALLCVHSSFAIILMGKRELVALLCLSSWCLLILVWLFLTMPQAFLKFVIVVFPDHTHYFGKKLCDKELRVFTSANQLGGRLFWLSCIAHSVV